MYCCLDRISSHRPIQIGSQRIIFAIHRPSVPTIFLSIWYRVFKYHFYSIKDDSSFNKRTEWACGPDFLFVYSIIWLFRGHGPPLGPTRKLYREAILLFYGLHIMGCLGHYIFVLFYFQFALFTGFAPGIILLTSKSPNYDYLSTINLTLSIHTLAQLYFDQIIQ